MHEIDAQTLLEQATLIGLISRDQAKAVRADAEDGSIEAVTRTLLRKDLLTAWQVEKFKKGDLSGFHFGGCKVLFHIAEGTFARVYRGRKMIGNQSVAIKVLRQRFVSDPAAIARFNQEAESGMRLIHPNIVQTYEYGEQDKKYFMIMEFVEGSNLRDFLRIRGRLTPQEALPLMIGLANGLMFSLDKGVTHRDLKASNILISSSGQAKLVDFGLATIEGEEKKMAAAHGQRTVDYSALERTCGSPKGDKRSDIFFLGCVFYQMITGVLPMPEVETNDPLKKMLKRGINTIKPLSDQRHAPDEALSRIIEKMMKVDLKARKQTMEQVVSDLDDYLGNLAGPAADSQPRRMMPGPGTDQATAPVVDEVDEVHGPESATSSETEAKRLLCVEAQAEVQDALRKYLTRMGYRVLLVSNPELAADRYRESPTEGVIFDADGLGPEALDAFLAMNTFAQENGNNITAIVLLGPRQHYLAKRFPSHERIVILPKPLKMKQIQDAIQRLVPLH